MRLQSALILGFVLVGASALSQITFPTPLPTAPTPTRTRVPTPRPTVPAAPSPTPPGPAPTLTPTPAVPTPTRTQPAVVPTPAPVPTNVPASLRGGLVTEPYWALGTLLGPVETVRVRRMMQGGQGWQWIPLDGGPPRPVYVAAE